MIPGEMIVLEGEIRAKCRSPNGADAGRKYGDQTNSSGFPLSLL